MNVKLPMEKYRIVYSLRIKIGLQKLGFESEAEMDNVYKPPFKCWLYLNTPEFAEAFSRLIEEGKSNG